MCRHTIRGLCTDRRSWPGPVGIPIQESGSGDLFFRSESDLGSGSLPDLDGVGITGAVTGMATPSSTTTRRTFPEARRFTTATFTIGADTAAPVHPAAKVSARLITVRVEQASRSRGIHARREATPIPTLRSPRPTHNPGCTRAPSAVTTMAVSQEAIPRAVARAGAEEAFTAEAVTIDLERGAVCGDEVKGGKQYAESEMEFRQF